MKLTKKKALEESIKIWSVLSKSGDKDKPEWSEKYDFCCPLCHFYNYNATNDCSKCCLNFEGLCFHGVGDAYYKWGWSLQRKTRQKYAKIILEALKKEYKKVK